jgi:hypothetical protein
MKQRQVGKVGEVREGEKGLKGLEGNDLAFLFQPFFPAAASHSFHYLPVLQFSFPRFMS